MNIDCITFSTILEDDMTQGEVELRLTQVGDAWRVSTHVDPADPQYDDFPSREAALAFLKRLMAQVL